MQSQLPLQAAAPATIYTSFLPLNGVPAAGVALTLHWNTITRRKAEEEKQVSKSDSKRDRQKEYEYKRKKIT